VCFCSCVRAAEAEVSTRRFDPLRSAYWNVGGIFSPPHDASPSPRDCSSPARCHRGYRNGRGSIAPVKDSETPPRRGEASVPSVSARTIAPRSKVACRARSSQRPLSVEGRTLTRRSGLDTGALARAAVRAGGVCSYAPRNVGGVRSVRGTWPMDRTHKRDANESPRRDVSPASGRRKCSTQSAPASPAVSGRACGRNEPEPVGQQRQHGTPQVLGSP
jgi:hypothetical protein